MPQGRRRKFFATADEARKLLLYLEDHTIGEAASFFGCSTRTVDYSLDRLRKQRKAPNGCPQEPVFQDPLSGAAERNTDRTRSTTMGAPSPKEKSA
jgi:DNA-directed RNA polymerase specialized sigma24 family protein